MRHWVLHPSSVVVIVSHFTLWMSSPLCLASSKVFLFPFTNIFVEYLPESVHVRYLFYFNYLFSNCNYCFLGEFSFDYIYYFVSSLTFFSHWSRRFARHYLPPTLFSTLVADPSRPQTTPICQRFDVLSYSQNHTLLYKKVMYNLYAMY